MSLVVVITVVGVVYYYKVVVDWRTSDKFLWSDDEFTTPVESFETCRTRSRSSKHLHKDMCFTKICVS